MMESITMLSSQNSLAREMEIITTLYNASH
jgi:hypothetical protein